MAVVTDTIATLMATTMVTGIGIVIIVVQSAALAIRDEVKDQEEQFGSRIASPQVNKKGCRLLNQLATL